MAPQENALMWLSVSSRYRYSRALVMPWNLSLFPAPLRSRWGPQHVGIKSPAWPPCQHQRGFVIPRVQGRSWNHWKLAAFAINTPVATGASCQRSGRVCHGPVTPHTSAVLLSLPDGSQQVLLAGWQNQQAEGCSWGQESPRGSVPCAHFAVMVTQPAQVRPLAWPAGPCTDGARARSCTKWYFCGCSEAQVVKPSLPAETVVGLCVFFLS